MVEGSAGAFRRFHPPGGRGDRGVSPPEGRERRVFAGQCEGGVGELLARPGRIPMKKRPLLSVACLIAAMISTSPLLAQSTPSLGDSTGHFPDTQIGRLGHALVDVINTGDSA